LSAGRIRTKSDRAPDRGRRSIDRRHCRARRAGPAGAGRTGSRRGLCGCRGLAGQDAPAPGEVQSSAGTTATSQCSTAAAARSAVEDNNEARELPVIGATRASDMNCVFLVLALVKQRASPAIMLAAATLMPWTVRAFRRAGNAAFDFRREDLERD